MTPARLAWFTLWYMLAVAAALGLILLTWEMPPPSTPRRTRPPAIDRPAVTDGPAPR